MLKKVQEKLMLGQSRAVCLPNELIAVLVGYASSAGNYPTLYAVHVPSPAAPVLMVPFFLFAKKKGREEVGKITHSMKASINQTKTDVARKRAPSFLFFWSQGSLWPICQYVVHSLTSKIAYNGCHVPAISEKVEGPFRDSKSCLVLNSACKERSR